MTGANATAARPPAGPLIPPRLNPDPTAQPSLVPNATLIGRTDLTDAIAIYRVRPDDGPRPFVAGQYFSLGLIVEGTLQLRPYSTASAEGSEDLEFLIRRVPGGTFTPALWNTAVRDRVVLGRAKGLFRLQADDPRSHLFVATGTGLAPFIAMLAAISRRPTRPRAVVVHGVAFVDELAYRDHLGLLHSQGAVSYLPIVSRAGETPHRAWDGAHGRTTHVLPGLFEDLDPLSTVAYLCGNPAMIEDARGVLGRIGLPSAAIITERYWVD